MRIYEIMHDWFEVEKVCCSVAASEVSHCFYSIIYVLVVSLNVIVVMFQPCSFCLYWYAKHEFCCMEEEFGECFFVGLKFVTHENNLPFAVISLKYLLITSILYLPQKQYAVERRSFLNKKMS